MIRRALYSCPTAGSAIYSYHSGHHCCILVSSPATQPANIQYEAEEDGEGRAAAYAEAA
jgi:hypothetical protein